MMTSRYPTHLGTSSLDLSVRIQVRLWQNPSFVQPGLVSREMKPSSGRIFSADQKKLSRIKRAISMLLTSRWAAHGAFL